MDTPPTPKNQQQLNQQCQNVQIPNFITPQPQLKQCSFALGNQTENEFDYNGIHTNRVNHSCQNSTCMGHLNIQTKNQDSIETMRNDISSYRIQKNFLWNKKNQSQENSMQQDFNYLNQIQAQIDLLRAKIIQRNNEDNGNRLPSINFNDSNHLEISTNQLSFPKSYFFFYFYKFSFLENKNFKRKQKEKQLLDKSSKKIKKTTANKNNKNELINRQNYEPKVRKSLSEEVAKKKSVYNFMSHVIRTILPRLIAKNKFDSVIEELMPDQNLKIVREDLRNELNSIKNFQNLFDSLKNSCLKEIIKSFLEKGMQTWLPESIYLRYYDKIANKFLKQLGGRDLNNLSYESWREGL